MFESGSTKVCPNNALFLIRYASYTVTYRNMGAAPAVHMSRLNVEINMLLRSIMGVRYIGERPTLDTTSMYNQLGILKLKNVFKLRLYSLLVSLLNRSLPDFLNLFLAPYLTAHNNATRRRIFRTPLASCEVEHRAVSCQLIRLYEEIPAQYCNIDSSSHGRLIRHFKQHIYSVQ